MKGDDFLQMGPTKTAESHFMIINLEVAWIILNVLHTPYQKEVTLEAVISSYYQNEIHQIVNFRDLMKISVFPQKTKSRVTSITSIEINLTL